MYNTNKNDWSDSFERLMRNRMRVGCFRYGALGERGKKQYKRIDSIRKRLKKYIDTGNKEMLVDIANLCMCEFEEGSGSFFSENDYDHVNII